MNDYSASCFFNLLMENSKEVNSKELSNAYDEFVRNISDSVQQEEDNTVIFRVLDRTRIDLTGLQNLSEYGAGEKCAQTYFPA